MKLSRPNIIPTTKTVTSVFGGYNHSLRIAEGEWFDMKNLTSADYPVLSPRAKRGEFVLPNGDVVSNAVAMIAKDELYYISGSILYKGSKFIYGFSGDKDRSLISFGANLIVMPDKLMVNTNTDKVTDLEASYTSGKNVTSGYKGVSAGTITFAPSTLDGAEYEATSSEKAPEAPKPLDYWLDTSIKPNVLKQYDGNTEEWVIVATTHIKITEVLTVNDEVGPVNENESFLTSYIKAGDGITISGINLNAVTNQADREQLQRLMQSSVVRAAGSNYIVVSGMLNNKITQDTVASPIEFKRAMPEMDFIIESGNRLWGCKYGETASGKFVNAIYASKLGDPTNWKVFDGISTDSYEVTVGTDGAFTGAISYGGTPHFFKENHVHKIYGNYPSNFQVQTTALRGVQSGCHKSMALVNETLFYKARTGICAYDGSLPTEVSSALGDVAYANAVAGALGSKYYVSMEEVSASTDKYRLFVFDAAKGMWHKEDHTQAVQFEAFKGNLYYIDYASGNKIKSVRHEDGQLKEIDSVKWMAQTGIIGVDDPDKKYISALSIRMMLDFDTTVRVFIEYDSCGEFEQIYVKTADKLSSISVPLRPKRCDHFRLRIEGEGMAKIFSICKTIMKGSASR